MLVSFLFINMANLLQIKLWEVLQKQIGKMWPKSSKTLVKDKTPVKLQAWHFISKIKISHWKRSLRKGVLKKFAKFTGKSLYWSLFFHKITGQKSATLSKKRLQHRSFPVNFAKFLRRPFSENTFGRLLLQNLFVRLIPKQVAAS